MSRRVVVTGIGPVTPIGTGKEKFWTALLSGKSGVRRVDDLIDLSGIDVRIGAPVLDFNPLDYMDRRRAQRIDRSAQFALAAARLALQDAGLEKEGPNPERTGVIIGTGIGGMETMESNFSRLAKLGPKRVSPFFVPRLMPNAVAAQVAIEYGLHGANFGAVSACASGAHAIGIAGELIRSGFLDCALAGGAEAVMIRITYAGFTQLGALSRRNDQPERASRPFDRQRDGFIIGEGAGILVLEERKKALARGAHIYAELIGFGMSADAEHITAPTEDGSGAAAAINIALKRGNLAPDEVEYINAHGTSTLLNDIMETKAIKLSLGKRANRVKISSTKSQIGHLLGAAGGVEAIATMLSMDNGKIPATINYEHPDPECDLDYTPVMIKQRPAIALSNSFGFGGQNAVLLFKRST
ncbi:MAG: beta-ketoacyl-ACP synthase II [Candidatus Bipolaricaulota bacterium]|nr:beta-ketoacyl-ACP synthase II [Candidatus Bipolaricaulota bacterium]